MKAILKTTAEAGSLEVREVQTPKPASGQVLVKMKATGICYTDISILNNKYKGRKPVPIPVVLGHEGAGIVAKAGRDVKNVTVGDRVGLEALWGCGTCVNCINGHQNMCTDWEHIGITLPRDLRGISSRSCRAQPIDFLMVSRLWTLRFLSR